MIWLNFLKNLLVPFRFNYYQYCKIAVKYYDIVYPYFLMILLSIDNPVYNTIIVFSIIMLLLYLIRPDLLYDNEKKEFRQFGTTNGKTLLPIYVVGILLAIILYVFFYHLSLRNKNSKNKDIKANNLEYVIHDVNDKHEKNDEYLYLLQQQQIHQLQNQINHFMQQQLQLTQQSIYHSSNQPSNHSSNQLSNKISNQDQTNLSNLPAQQQSIEITRDVSHSNDICTDLSKAFLPNSLSV